MSEKDHEENSRASGDSSSTEDDEDVKQRSTVASQRLSREERQDLVQQLEHIVTIGSHVRHSFQRARKWNRSSPSTDPQMLHAQDVQLYGEKYGRRMSPFPTEKKGWPCTQNKNGMTKNDKVWDRLHGDGIHPLAFSEARLSDVPPSKRQRVNGPNLSVDTTDPTVGQAQVPRAMLLRCWERAVHSAASTVPVPALKPSEPSEAQSSTTDHQREVEMHSHERAVQKCKELNLSLEDEDTTTCPCCGIEFDSDVDLKAHFYGRTNQQRGCCWTTIRHKQYELLDQLLQNQVTECALILIHTILTFIDDRQRQEESNVAVHSWKHVVDALETKWDSPASGRECEILESLRMRLVERYASTPP